MSNIEFKKSCLNCKFNFAYVCAGYGRRTDNGEYTYGMLPEETQKMFPEGCSDWQLSLDAYIDLCESHGMKFADQFL